MYVNRHNRVTKQFGFSLWELSIVMLIMIGLFVALVNIMPHIVKRENVEIDKTLLVKMDEQLLGFVATYSRLPCPDANNNGFEDCTASSGAIPYKTLGLNEDYAGVGSIPVQYAVFRNTTDQADLANITDLFNPTDSHDEETTFGNVNGLDFCTAIENGKASTFNASYAHVLLPDGTTRAAVPYVLVTAGLSNADGTTSPFDGLNSTAALDFEAANKEHTASYDDTVFTKSFDELSSTLNCDTAINSLNLLADGKATHIENEDQADNLKGNAELGAFILGAQILLGIANTAMAAFTLFGAVTTLAAGSALLSAAVASCIILVGCALIPVYTTGVIAATIAVVAAGVSVAANVAALVTQGVALGLTIDVALRAGAQISLPESSSADENDPSATIDNAQLAIQVRAEAEKLKADAAEKVIAARNNSGNTIGLAVTIRNRINNIRNQTQALANTATAVNDTAFTNFANASNNQAAVNQGQLNTAINNLNTANGHANNAVADLGTPVNSGFPLFEITYPNVDFPAVEADLRLADKPYNPDDPNDVDSSLMTAANTQFTNFKNSYLNIKTQANNARIRAQQVKAADTYPTPADPAMPTAAETTAINNWNVRQAGYNDAINKAQAVINSIDATRQFFYTEVRDRRNGVQDSIDELIDIRDTLPPIEPLGTNPAPNQDQIDAHNARLADRAEYLAVLNASLNEQYALRNYYDSLVASICAFSFCFFDLNILQDEVQIEFGRIEGAKATTTEAFQTIASALQAEEDAQYFEDNVGNGLPNANGSTLTQAGGVDDILRAADAKGTQQ